jgi:hypothetical protein
MNSRLSITLRVVAILLLLMLPGLAPFPQSGARHLDETISPLQDNVSSINPRQEKRSEVASVQVIEYLFSLEHPEPPTPIHRMWPHIAYDVPKISSLLVYTQTTSTFL